MSHPAREPPPDLVVSDNGVVINHYCTITQSSLSAGSKTVEVTGCHDINRFFHKKALIIQMQHAMESVVGTHEIVTVDEIAPGTLRLLGKIKNSYKSAIPNKARNSFVAQIVTVPEFNTLTVEGSIVAKSWDGQTGGVVIVETHKNLVVEGTVEANYAGFRGGKCTTFGCNNGGWQGESWTGPGGAGGKGLTTRCCSGSVNAIPRRGDGKADNNGGGGAGGAGSCHGGGGGGGVYSEYIGNRYCQSQCRPGGTKPVDGSPECSRSGLWAYGGEPYGGGKMLERWNLGSGGGSASDHSSNCGSQNNAGGNGGGMVVLLSQGDIQITPSGSVTALGDQGRPNKRIERSKFEWWSTVNTQDGSGGAGSGGMVLLRSQTSRSASEKVSVEGGDCGASTGWPHRNRHAQVGGRGGFGRIKFEYAEGTGAPLAAVVRSSRPTTSLQKIEEA